MAAFLGRLSDAAWVVAAVLVAAAALRLGLVGFGVAVAARGAPADSNVPLHRRKPPPLPSTSAKAVESGPGEAVLTTLAVTVGPARSEVYVNRQRVGKTPFFGDVSCKKGEPLRIEVVPSDTPLLSFDRTCRRGLSRIDRPDGEDPLTAPEK